MARNVLVAGGWVTENRLLYDAAESFVSEYYPDANSIRVVTLDEARSNPALVQGENVADTSIVSHSSGAIAVLQGIIKNPTDYPKPDELVMLAPPLRRSLVSLVTEFPIQAMNALRLPTHSAQEIKNLGIFGASALVQILTNPFYNLSYLQEISHFDSLESGSKAAQKGLPTVAAFYDGDPFFRPTAHEHISAQTNGVDVHFLPGEHETFLVSPRTTAAALLQSMRPPQILPLSIAS